MSNSAFSDSFLDLPKYPLLVTGRGGGWMPMRQWHKDLPQPDAGNTSSARGFGAVFTET